MNEEMLCDLVGDDALEADEDLVLKAVGDWIEGGGDEGRGEYLLGEIRYGLLTASRLAEVWLKAEEMLAGLQGSLLRELASEAIAMQELPASVREGREHRLLGSHAFSWRKGMGVAWVDYAEGGDSIRLCETSKT